MAMQGVSEKKVKFSVVIPAYNEEKYITKCLDSILKASVPYKDQVEIIVVLNQCTDRTEEIALSYGCVVVREDAKNLSKIRNAGAKIAKGEILITIDADSWMSDTMLIEIEKHLMSGKYVGGGVMMKQERMSFGIMASTLALLLMCIPTFIKHGFVSLGLLWCFKEDFDAIKGFDENRFMAEDGDFALRLKEHGKTFGKIYGTITKAHIITSSRKFDGKNRKCSDEFYYDVKR